MRMSTLIMRTSQRSFTNIQKPKNLTHSQTLSCSPHDQNSNPKKRERKKHREIESNLMESVVKWSKEEEKSFENSIAIHCINEDVSEDQWRKMALMIPTKSLEDLKKHYQILLEDVNAIENGQVPLPRYNGRKSEEAVNSPVNRDCNSSGGSGSSEKKGIHGGGAGISGGNGGRSGGGSRAEQERKKGIPWTEEEHRFLLLLPYSFIYPLNFIFPF